MPSLQTQERAGRWWTLQMGEEFILKYETLIPYLLLLKLVLHWNQGFIRLHLFLKAERIELNEGFHRFTINAMMKCVFSSLDHPEPILRVEK